MPLPSGVTRTVNKKTGKEYWYHQNRRGKADAGPRTTLPEFGTPQFWAAIAKLTGETKPPGNTISSLIETLKTQPEWLKHRPNTVSTYEAALTHIEAAWGKLDPAGLTPAHILALRASFADRPSMGNMVLVMTKAILKLAVQLGWRSDNPAREIDKLGEEPDEAKPFTEEAWLAITSPAAPLALRRYAVLGRATGQRISDIIRMRPADRDEDGIKTTITKLHDQPHWCPLTAAEIREIDGWKQFANATYVTKAGGGRHTDPSFRYEWKTFAETDAGSALASFSPHDLRATKVCDERIKGTSHQQIAAKVGMSIQMVMKYSRHIDQRLAARGTGPEQERAKIDNA